MSVSCIDAPPVQLVAFNSRLGWTAIRMQADTLLARSFGHARQADAVGRLALESPADPIRPQLAVESARSLAERLIAYAEGEVDDFRDVPVALDHYTLFERRVVEACRRIGFGQTVSYGRLAQQAGSPRAARAVGRVMSRNRAPIIVPCHRVLGAGGRLGGYSAPQGLTMKRRLLDLEESRQ